MTVRSVPAASSQHPPVNNSFKTRRKHTVHSELPNAVLISSAKYVTVARYAAHAVQRLVRLNNPHECLQPRRADGIFSPVLLTAFLVTLDYGIALSHLDAYVKPYTVCAGPRVYALDMSAMALCRKQYYSSLKHSTACIA